MKLGSILLGIIATIPLCQSVARPAILHPNVSRLDTRNVVCFYGNWAAYRPDYARLTVEKIDSTICTHIIYGSLGMDENGTIESNLPDVDFDEGEGLDSIKKLHDLKERGVKLLFSVGGAQVSSDEFSVMVSNEECRERFVNSTMKFIQDHHLDGIDIDWRFPGSMGGVPDDKINFIKLLRELQGAFKQHDYILSAQVASTKNLIESGYDIPLMNKYLDMINIMAFDHQESRDNRTRLIAPLHQSKDDTRSRRLTVEWAVNKWIESGAHQNKINLGITTYGTSYTLDDPSIHGINAPSHEPGNEGPITMMRGLLGYNEICQFLKSSNYQPYWRTISWLNRWRVVRDSDADSVYAYRGNQWISYEDQDTIKEKVKYALSLKLGGLMVYGIDADDFRGRCTGVKFPLTRTIVSELNNQITYNRLSNL